MPTCPFSDAVLSPTDLKEGWCDNCGKKVPAFVTASTSMTTRRAGDLADVSTDKPDEAYWGYNRNRLKQGKIASLGSRFLGALVDGIIGFLVFLPGVALIAVTVIMKSDPPNGLAMAVLLGGVPILAIVQIVFLSRDGQTLGKKFAHTRIINQSDGTNPGFGGAFVMRGLVPGMISAIPCVGQIFALVDLLSIFGEDHRRLADKIAGTVVVEA